MRKMVLSVCVLSSALATQAVPRVVDSSVTVDGARPRAVKIDYTLAGEPAVVTVEVFTNGIAVGAAGLRALRGDVNRLVQPGRRRIVWNARVGLAGVEGEISVSAEVTAWSTNCPPDYLVVDLVGHGDEPRFRYYVSEAALPFEGGVQDARCKTDYMVFRKIPAAGVTWRMGAGPKATKEGEARECDGSRESPHLVTLEEDYYLGVFEVTQRQYTNTYPHAAGLSKFTREGDLRPAESTEYNIVRGGAAWPVGGRTCGAWGYLATLQQALGVPPGTFDLPTEAEWEYACRAGCDKAYGNGGLSTWADEKSPMTALGRFRYNATPSHDVTRYDDTVYPTIGPADGGTAVVGSYAPNAWGLYDMHGNVSELCPDGFCEYTDADYNPRVGKVPADDAAAANFPRVFRGGSWNANGHCCRAARRDKVGKQNQRPSVGFRLWASARAVK